MAETPEIVSAAIIRDLRQPEIMNIPPAPQQREALEDIEISVLLEAIYRHYGVDFRDYSAPYVRRRIHRTMLEEKVQTVSQLQDRILHNPASWKRLVSAIAIHVTSLFRDPGFYRMVRNIVIPLISQKPFVRIWHAGCATGEEVYSTAIILHEAGLSDRCRIYATDINDSVLKTARLGIYPLALMKAYSNNYFESGGTHSLSRYYTARYDSAILRSHLKKNIVFSKHDLVVDSVFNEFDVIFCRNVMIYFNKELQTRVHALLHTSLAPEGILALGDRETIKFTALEHQYQELVENERVYRKI